MVGPRTGLLSLALLVPACCVHAATLVSTPRGEVAAGSLVIGDRVWSVDVASGGLVEGLVVAVRRATRECVTLHWDAGSLTCTTDHPLFDPERGEYRPAGDWVTNAARQLLRWTEAGPVAVVVARIESFVGLHEVVDLSLASEPHNFVAAGIVVHNKTLVGPSTTKTVEGPDVALTVLERHGEFRVKVCEDGQDTAGFFRLYVDARGVPIPEGGKGLWLSAYVDTELLETVDGPAPGSLEVIEADLPPGSCGEGFIVGFQRLDERSDGSIEIDWRLEVHGSYGYQEEEDALSVVIEPEP
jgi:hypothetical protein